jgi:hypothetical protein
LTVTKVTKLTNGQRAKFPAIVNKYIQHGLATKPANRASVENGIRRCYAIAGFRDDIPIVWVTSPIVGAFAAPIANVVIKQMMHSEKAVSSAIIKAVYSGVHSAINSAVDSAVDSAVSSAIYSAVYSAVDSAVNSAVDSAVHSAVSSAIF